MRVTEGGVELEVPGEQAEGVEEDVFYNPRQELNRDLTVAVLRAYREREPRATSYLDAMTASGIRGLRARQDGWEVTCCDVEDAAVSLTRANFERNGLEARIEHRNVNALLHEQPFDVVDLDPYGAPMPYADAAMANCRDLVCVTATDTAPLCGAHFNSGVRSYSAIPQNTEYHTEMGVRILLSALARSGARFDTGVTPLLTYGRSHYVRTFLELEHRATDADATLDQLGYLYHCEDCLYRESSRGLIASPLESCPHCNGTRLLTAGPVWCGPIRDRAFCTQVADHIPASFGTASTGSRLLERLDGELETPTHYDQHKLCKNWGEPANAMDDFLEALDDAGYDTSRTHYGGTTFKTDADIGAIRTATEPTLGS